MFSTKMCVQTVKTADKQNQKLHLFLGVKKMSGASLHTLFKNSSINSL